MVIVPGEIPTNTYQGLKEDDFAPDPVATVKYL